ncbi:hypothetical protein BC827DRAFT_291288 [Russula dissimulans]|nr:hypothetical protein BC827DRAFT_291288 [Russula dissimulans]
MDRYVKQSNFKFRKQTTLSVCPIGVLAGDENRNVGVESLRSSSVGDPARLSSPFFISRTLEKPNKHRSTSYMHSTTRHPASEVMQRSQSTPNVGVRPTEQRVQRPRRTKTNVDFLAAPHRNAIHREKYVDPFNLASFFPAGLRRSDEEPSGWWRDEGPEEGSDEPARESVMMDSDSNPSGSQRALFHREDLSSEVVVKREDKPGVLTLSGGSDRGTVQLDGWDRGMPTFAVSQ